jgi:hypothetical protein
MLPAGARPESRHHNRMVRRLKRPKNESRLFASVTVRTVLGGRLSLDGDLQILGRYGVD